MSIDRLHLQEASQLTTAAKFSEALDKLRGILLAVPLIVVDTKQEVSFYLYLLLGSQIGKLSAQVMTGPEISRIIFFWTVTCTSASEIP